MSTEQIYKLQPDRTLYLRGFTGVGAAASLCQASPTGFTVCGVFRDMADFCVLMLHDADNTFEHYTIRYLPDFDLSGLVLTFDLSYQGLQPLDSSKYSWIDWAQLDVIKSDETTVPTANPIRFWDHATLTSGNFSVAQGTFQITAPGGCTVYDRLTLFVNNASFDFLAAGGETATYVAQTIANSINAFDWSTSRQSSVSVLASADDSGNLTLKNARAGQVSVSGNTIQWVSGTKFPGIAAGSTIYLAGDAYTVASVNTPQMLTLTAAATPVDGRTVPYLAEYGGVDGNGVVAYMVVRPGNVTLAASDPVLQLTGGNSDNVTWTVSLDFTKLGIDQIRQAWMTFAPQLSNEASYSDTEWVATFTNWTVTDANNIRQLKCAGAGSVRVGNDELGVVFYGGSGWTTQAANNFWHGFGRTTSNPGDSISVTYSCQRTHDLYLGTLLGNYAGMVSVSLDGDAATILDCYITGADLIARRKVRNSVSAGTHTVTFTLLDQVNPAAKPLANASGEFRFLLDYL
ncbi:MAG: hypothetical protein JO033_28755, partial [Acidobacteriaceae bacterium]|nr:hypothetical protein [Acidobacteriaceae bacterium]